MSFKQKWFFFLCMVGWTALPFRLASGADRIPVKKSSAAEENALKLSLRDCLILALHNNMDIKVEGLNPGIGLAQLLQAKGVFDPVFQVVGDRLKSKRPSSSILEGRTSIETLSDQYSVTFGEKFITGGSYELRFSHRRYDTDTFIYKDYVPQYTNNLIISLSHPLLKNAWRTFNAGMIRIESNSCEISKKDFINRVMDILFNVESEYWNLVFYRENLEVKKLSLKEAEELLRINRIKVEAGVYPGNEIVYALAGVAQRKTEVLAAEKDLKDAEDRLKQQILSLHELEEWEVSIIPTEQPAVPKLAPLDWESEALEALEKRPDLEGSALDIQNKDIAVAMAENQLLPTFDVRGSYSWNALSLDFRDNVRDIFSDHFRDWGVGITFEVPLGNRSAQGSLRKARLEKRRSQLNHQILIHDTVRQVREAVRRVETAWKLVFQTRRTVEATLEQLRSEEKKLEVGSSTSYNVLLILEDLAVAESNNKRAILDFQIALANLDKVKGVLLEKNGIQASIR